MHDLTEHATCRAVKLLTQLALPEHVQGALPGNVQFLYFQYISRPPMGFSRR